jgi:tetratricopeptide (TPR) repeat protein
MTLLSRVENLILENKLFEAESAVLQALSDGEPNEECYATLATVHAARRDFGECLRALDLSGQNSQAAVVLLAQMGFYVEASVRLSAARSEEAQIQTLNQNTKAQQLSQQLYSSAEAAVTLELYDVAEQSLKLSLAVAKSVESFLCLANVCWKQNKRQEALDVLWNAKNQFPSDSRVFTKLAYYMLLQGNKRGAHETLLKARALGDESAFAQSLFLWCEGK